MLKSTIKSLEKLERNSYNYLNYYTKDMFKKILAVVLIAGSFVMGSLLARPSEVLAEVDATTYGVVCDGTTDDRAAIQSALDAAKKVILPEGICIIDAAIGTVHGLLFNDNNVLEGQGRSTILKKANSAIVHPIGIYDVVNTEIRDLAIIGDSTTGGHGIRGTDVNGLVIDNVYLEQVNYGIAFADGTNQNLYINNTEVRDIAGDCFDLKNPDNLNRYIFITNFTCHNPDTAGIDIRGIAVVNGAQITGLRDGAVGIRFRQTGVTSVGQGAHGSSATNFYVEGIDESATIGVSIPGSYAQVSNGYVWGTLYGVQIGASHVLVTNINVRETTSHGFVVDEPANLVSLVNVSSRNSGGYGYKIIGDRVSLSSVMADGANSGAGYIATQASYITVTGSIFTSNGAGWSKLGTNIVESANHGF